MEQKQILSILNDKEEAPDPKNRTEYAERREQHRIVPSTVLLVTEWFLQPKLYGVQKDAQVLWDMLKEDSKSKMMMNVWDWQDTISAVRLSDCENVQEYSSKIQSNVRDFNLCTRANSSSTGSGKMLKSKHIYYLMKGVEMDNDWRYFT